MKKIKEMTHEQRLKWLSIARGPELLRAYHLAINNYNAKDSEKVFNYDSVREEILKRLNYQFTNQFNKDYNICDYYYFPTKHRIVYQPKQ